MNETAIFLFDRAGVFVFALSGGLAAVCLKMDLLGIVIIGLLPTLGGGTLRDLLVDAPVFWLEDAAIVLVAAGGGLAGFCAFRLWNRIKCLVWVDAIGLSLFAVMGAAKTFEMGYGVVTTVIIGTITATAGGLIRDVVCNERPLLLSEYIYLTAAITGSAVYWFFATLGVDSVLSMTVGGLAVFGVRGAGILFSLNNLPKPR